IYPCHQFAGNKDFLMGNVKEGILKKDIRKSFAENSLFTREDCDNCFAKFICSGGCSANNYNFMGNVNKPYPVTCAMMKKRIECGMHALARKKDDKN
ncbi:MAG: SPASM domain-containing protein, partial [Clostridia bacterium]|nr:SPASM domain-containing protein [Clostridia bacterium]